jgi:hypothetical protein
MKKILFLFVLGVFTLTVTAQKSAIIVFSEDGEAFDLIVNGEKKNDAPSTNVKVLNINEGNYRLVVKFQNAQIANVTQNAMVEPGTEYTFALKRNKKGVMVMRYFGDAPYNATAAEPAKEQQVVADEQPVRSNVKGNQTGGETVNISTTVTETSKTKPGAASVTMNISADGANMGVNMKVDGMEMEPETATVTTTVTSTSTTTSSSSGGYIVTETSSGTSQNQGGTYIVGETSTSTGGCKGRSSMTSTSFQSALESIKSKSFEDTKITTVKQIVKANCITVSQLSQIIKLLTFEESKVEIAKFAYDYVSDTNNYFQINDLFTFSGSVDELNEYLESK